MNPCDGAPAELLLERYIQGTLPDAEAQQFEEHYFDCPVCVAQVEALQAVRTRLAGLPVNEQPTAQTATTKRAKLFAWPTPMAAMVALAASLFIVFLSYRFLLPEFFVHRYHSDRAAVIQQPRSQPRRHLRQLRPQLQ